MADVLTTLFPVWVHTSCPPQSCHAPLRGHTTYALCDFTFLTCLAQVCLGAAIGISRPQSVAWCTSGLFTSLLGFLMLSMGLTLTFEDFKKASSSSIFVCQTCSAISLMQMPYGAVCQRSRSHRSGLPSSIHCKATAWVRHCKGTAPVIVANSLAADFRHFQQACMPVSAEGLLRRHHQFVTCSLTTHCRNELLSTHQTRAHFASSESGCSCPLQALNLSPALATGLILVSCCPGGQVGRYSPPLSLTCSMSHLLILSLSCCFLKFQNSCVAVV